MSISELDKKIVTISALIGADRLKPEHFVTRSGYFLQKGACTLALEDAKAALSLDSKCLPACIAAAKAFLRMKHFEDSYSFFKEGLKIDPKSAEIIDGLKELQDHIVADHAQKTKENSYNAVDMCSQDIYPGDDELFRREQEILSTKYKIVLVADQGDQNGATLASQKEANKETILAHQCHIMGKTEEALHHCDVALSKDVTNNAARYLRAQINIARKNMEIALQDLWMIPKSRRNTEVWKMGGKMVW